MEQKYVQGKIQTNERQIYKNIQMTLIWQVPYLGKMDIIIMIGSLDIWFPSCSHLNRVHM